MNTKSKGMIKSDERIESEQPTFSSMTTDDRKKFRESIESNRNTVHVGGLKDGVLLIGDEIKEKEQVHQDLLDTTGTNGFDSASLILAEIARFGKTKEGDPGITNNLLKMLHGIGPKDNIESMLATQMIATHALAMNCATMANTKEQSLEHFEKKINQLTKLNRAFVAQMDALNKHRGKGQQKMTVEHVHVNEGGQAIIGNVEGGKNGNGK